MVETNEIVHLMEPAVRLITPALDIAKYPRYIEMAARECYQSHDKAKGEPEKFVKMLIKRGHTSALEHCKFIYHITCSRAASHQLVRHRHSSYCLAGDTVVPAFRKNEQGGKQWTIRQLWEWSNDPKRKGRLKLINLRGVNELGELAVVKISSIVDTGVKKVYRLTTASGRSIRATGEHRFLTPDGWRQLGELSVGQLVLANGALGYDNPEYLKKRYLDENMSRSDLAKELGVSDSFLGKRIREFGLQKPKQQYPGRKPGRGRKGMFSEETLQRLREQKVGPNNPRWKGDNVGIHGGYIRTQKHALDTCSRCGKDAENRHHKDRDPANTTSDNIEQLCVACHKAEHYGMTVMTVFSDVIIAIEDAGMVDTYDIEIDDECHNFIADGLVVHNSQQSQRYVVPEVAEVIYPPHFGEARKGMFKQMMAQIYESYGYLLKEGAKPEDARFVLPNACVTRVVTSSNMRQIRQVFALRLEKHAQWEIRGVHQQLFDMLYDIVPCFVEDLKHLRDTGEQE